MSDEKEFFDAAAALGHRLKMEGDQVYVVDSVDDHSVVVCERCDGMWCKFCGVSQLKPCTGQRIVIHQVRKVVPQFEIEKSVNSENLLIAFFVEALEELKQQQLDGVEIIVQTREVIKS